MHAVLKRMERNGLSHWWSSHVCALQPGSGVFTHHFVILYQHHVVCTESSTKDDAGDTLETMDPLLSL